MLLRNFSASWAARISNGEEQHPRQDYKLHYGTQYLSTTSAVAGLINKWQCFVYFGFMEGVMTTPTTDSSFVQSYPSYIANIEHESNRIGRDCHTRRVPRSAHQPHSIAPNSPTVHSVHGH